MEPISSASKADTMLSPRCDLRFELLRSDGRLIITYPECIYKYFEGCVKINIALLLEFLWNKAAINKTSK